MLQAEVDDVHKRLQKCVCKRGRPCRLLTFISGVHCFGASLLHLHFILGLVLFAYYLVFYLCSAVMFSSCSSVVSTSQSTVHTQRPKYFTVNSAYSTTMQTPLLGSVHFTMAQVTCFASCYVSTLLMVVRIQYCFTKSTSIDNFFKSTLRRIIVPDTIFCKTPFDSSHNSGYFIYISS